MSGVSFQRDRASVQQIAGHLRLCDGQFTPSLSSRVDIAEYAGRLAAKSLRFEAWSQDDLVGLVAAYADDPEDHTAFITNVSVLGAWTRRGIGRRLLENCISHVRRQGRHALRLEVSYGQSAAIRLYESLGFECSVGARAPASGGSIGMHLALQEPASGRRDREA